MVKAIPRCGDCHARIAFVLMEATGKRVPVDPDVNDRGNVVARGEPARGGARGRVVPAGQVIADHEDRYMPHFATCPARAKRDGVDGPKRPAPEPEPASLFDGIDL